MLFNSFEFIFFFLPIALLVFFQLGGRGYHKLALGWLVVISLCFYGYGSTASLGLFLFSLIFNYGMGKLLDERLALSISRQLRLSFGIVVNLALLGYFKYANFFVGSVNGIFATEFKIEQILLPLAISFFTFGQISYLVDTYRGKINDDSFLSYCFFVSFFPKLIAGPITRHPEIVPQLQASGMYQFNWDNFAVGLTIFSIGLFKKLIFADPLAPFVLQVFGAANQGIELTFGEAWLGALAYSLQLYFDFSGYTDMAIGVSRLFGIKLPLNFNSPYKAAKITQLWANWHMTLTRFFRDYLYLPLGRWLRPLRLGNEKQSHQRQLYINILIAMTLTGLWHGAGWNFVLWGYLNGVYLIVHQKWRELRRSLGHDLRKSTWWGYALGWCLTFTAWVIALVVSRSRNLTTIWTMWQAMFGFRGFSLTESLAATPNGLMPNIYTNAGSNIILKVMLLLLLAVLAPNTQQWIGRYQPALDHYVLKAPSNWKTKLWKRLQWQPHQLWSLISATIMIIAISSLSQETRFIYFQF